MHSMTIYEASCNNDSTAWAVLLSLKCQTSNHIPTSNPAIHSPPLQCSNNRIATHVGEHIRQPTTLAHTATYQGDRSLRQTHVEISSSVGALAPDPRPVISLTHSPIACLAPPACVGVATGELGVVSIAGVAVAATGVAGVGAAAAAA